MRTYKQRLTILILSLTHNKGNNKITELRTHIRYVTTEGHLVIYT